MVAGAHADSTKTKRSISWRHWLKFMALADFKINPLAPTELEVCLFLTYLYKRKLAYSTIRTYLYSLASEIKMRGGRQIFRQFEDWFIHTTLRYILRKLGTEPLRYRRPLTVDMLFKLVNESASRGDVFIAMLFLGVFGMLRVGELCYSKTKEVTKFITNGDVRFSKLQVEFTLRGTKTDLKKEGVLKAVASIPDVKFNPYDFIRSYQMSKTKSLGKMEPFFALPDGRPVTRPMLINYLQEQMARVYPKIPAGEWSGISLRKGGATSAMRAGLTGDVIEFLGHWKSDVYKRYISHDLTDVLAAQRKMCRITDI